MDNICEYPECSRVIHGQGLCSTHYAQYLSRGRDKSALTPIKRLNKVRGLCKFPNCELPHASKGYCRTHYSQLQYYSGDESKMKPIRGGGAHPGKCSFGGCGRLRLAKGLCDTHYNQTRLGEELKPIKGITRNPEGVTCQVPNCDRQVVENTLCQGHKRLVSQYKMSEDEIRDWFTDPKCGVCGVTGQARALHVDHDHACCPGVNTCGNCNRGLLCSNCNTTLGLVKESPETLQRMITYLEMK